MKRWLAVGLLALGASSRADTVAYLVPAGLAGNTTASGTLGLDFDVGPAPLVISEVGVFDDLGDGLRLPVTVRFYDRDGRYPLTALLFQPGEGVLDAGSRFKRLPCPLELPAGFRGTVTAEGYGPSERSINTTLGAPALPLSTADAGALLTFVSSRFGEQNAFPTRTLTPVQAQPYAAATFTFARRCSAEVVCEDPARPVCSDGLCGETPTFFPACPVDRPACDRTHAACVACVPGRMACPAPEAPWCDLQGQCVAACAPESSCRAPGPGAAPSRYQVTD
ncbi:MAG: hypothetical protein JNG84_13715, partial [Archangium sp.]|nr:hypothetical protein [Archangium sp.]